MERNVTMGTKQMERPQKPAEKQSRKQHKERQQEKQRKEQHADREKEQQRKRGKRRKSKRPRLRVFPIWLRIIVVLVLAAVALIVGLMVGYGVIGNGNPFDALHKETWQHIVDIVKKEK